jgi:hypothetical protein
MSRIAEEGYSVEFVNMTGHTILSSRCPRVRCDCPRRPLEVIRNRSVDRLRDAAQHCSSGV